LTLSTPAKTDDRKTVAIRYCKANHIPFDKVIYQQCEDPSYCKPGEMYSGRSCQRTDCGKIFVPHKPKKGENQYQPTSANNGLMACLMYDCDGFDCHHAYCTPCYQELLDEKNGKGAEKETGGRRSKRKPSPVPDESQLEEDFSKLPKKERAELACKANHVHFNQVIWQQYEDPSYCREGEKFGGQTCQKPGCGKAFVDKKPKNKGEKAYQPSSVNLGITACFMHGYEGFDCKLAYCTPCFKELEEEHNSGTGQGRAKRARKNLNSQY